MREVTRKKVILSKEEEEKLFDELWSLISECARTGGLSPKYPFLYQLYLRVATEERISRKKKAERRVRARELENKIKAIKETLNRWRKETLRLMDLLKDLETLTIQVEQVPEQVKQTIKRVREEELKRRGVMRNED